MMEPPKFQCLLCGKTYKRQIYYENHVSTCKINNLAKYDRNITREDDTSMTDLLLIVKELSNKYESVVKELATLRKYVEKTKRQINIPDWLDNNYPCIHNFKDWLREFNIKERHLELIFETDLITGFNTIIEEFFIVDDSIPIRCFKQKKSVFYIFSERWKMMNQKEFEFMVNCINSKIIRLLKEWQDSNVSLIESNSDLYQKNVMNVLGGNVSSSIFNTRIKNILFERLQFNLKQVIEYEFI